MSFKLGPRGEALIKSYETLRLKAFKPTPDDPWTIGWGRAHGVKEGDICTPQQSEEWFLEDVATAEKAINAKGWKLTQAMFDALCSLVYNAGEKVLSAENTIARMMQTNSYLLVWRAIDLWIIEGGQPSLGLARRRSKEMALFLEDGIPK